MLHAPLTPQLKRTFSATTGSVRSFEEAQYPLPQIGDVDLMLQVYTHKSLRIPGQPYDDNERLSELGSKALEMAVVSSLFRKQPLLTAEEISMQKDDFLSPFNFMSWVKGYKMMLRLRCLPEVFATITAPEESRSLFQAYMGAVYLDAGIRPVENWVDAFLGLDPGHGPPLKKVKAEPPSLPAFSPPPPTIANPMTPAQPGLAFLPLFNQTATQRRVQVEYPASFSGPSHAGRWTVECKVNGISKGIGTGASKQIAKEEAARQAFYAMGWS